MEPWGGSSECPARSLHSTALLGLLSGSDVAEMMAQPPGPPQVQNSPRVSLELTRADRKEAQPGLWGSLEEQRSGGVAQSSWESKGRRHSHLEPFLGHRMEGLSADQTGKAYNLGNREAPCGKLMRPQGLPAGPAHTAGWHGSQHVSTAWQTQVP